MVLVWPKTKHMLSLTTDFKVTASHDQISSASHLIENADACAFWHLQKCFTFSNSTNFWECSCPYLALKKLSMRIHSLGSVCGRYFPLSLIFVSLKWLYSDFCLWLLWRIIWYKTGSKSAPEHLCYVLVTVTVTLLALKRGKKGKKRIFSRIHVGINMSAPL